MTIEAGFVSAIREAPDEDGPRLIFADWCEDHGDPERAEFVRLQCRLARMKEEDAGRAELQERERLLLAEHGTRWAAPLAGMVRGCRFRRGFIEDVEIDEAGIFRWVHEEVFRLAPVRRLCFNDSQLNLEEFESIFHVFTLLEGLEFRLHQEPDSFRALLASASLRSLRRLALHDPGEDEEGVFSFDALSALLLNGEAVSLRELILGRVYSWDWRESVFARSPILPRLETLVLGSMHGDGRLQSLFAPATGLRHLGLTGWHFNGDLVQTLERCFAPGRLRRLSLPGCEASEWNGTDYVHHLPLEQTQYWPRLAAHFGAAVVSNGLPADLVWEASVRLQG